MEQFQQISRLYEARGFKINIVRGDGEFKCLQQDILPTRFDPAAADDHVDVVERSVQTVKADCRTLTHGLPFKRVPRLMVTEMIVHSIRTRNMFPSPDGISTTLSPLRKLRRACSLIRTLSLIEVWQCLCMEISMAVESLD